MQKNYRRLSCRTRDYTPSYSPNEPNGHSSESRKVSGHAKEYTAFLADQVIPLLQKHYRIDAGNKIFVGHSFGGLLGSYILVNRPEVFDHYIIGSPSFKLRILKVKLLPFSVVMGHIIPTTRSYII